MDPLIDMTPDTWIDWTAAFPAADDDTKLQALRNYIWATADRACRQDGAPARWMNKKLPQVGVSDRMPAINTYTLEVPVNGFYRTEIAARNRAEAERLFRSTFGSQVGTTHEASFGDNVAFIDGPEDVAPGDLPDDAPQTVDATLAKLRELILLAVVSGPRFCVSGTNRVLASFGLEPVPERKTFRVSRPVVGFAETFVEAFDEASAERVAGWRWADGRQGFAVGATGASETGSFVVAEA
jgi:hypothetical protein